MSWKRMVREYRCYDAGGKLVAKGTAMALVEKKVFGSETTVHEHYKTGRPWKPAGIVRMEMELRPILPKKAKKKAPPAAKPKPRRKPLGGVQNPSALAYDVHDLILYNKKARKIGKPELTYGYWAVAGKPARP